MRLERESIRAASCRQASRFTWHDFGRKTAEAIARTVAENARESQILNTTRSSASQAARRKINASRHGNVGCGL